MLLFVADLDPDGEEIAHSFTRSMRDDFALPKIQAFKVALTAEQVSEFDLPEDNLTMAKKTSSNYERFAEKHGNHAYNWRLRARNNFKTRCPKQSNPYWTSASSTPRSRRKRRTQPF